MDRDFDLLLQDWPLPVIKDTDVSLIFTDSASRRYAAVNRALKKGFIKQLRRSVYLIGKPYRKNFPNNFSIAHSLYGPSYISFESALSYHQWIPEAVYTTLCATSKRANDFDTLIGRFQYLHVPKELFYLGGQRIENNEESFLIAEPWKALADHYYVHGRRWENLENLIADMRIEEMDMRDSDLSTLKLLSEQYQSQKVRKLLKKILKEITYGN